MQGWAKMLAATMPVWSWNFFIKAFALAFLAYWVHLSHGLNDWLGTEGFHLISPASVVFAPLPTPWPLVLWWTTFTGGLFLLFSRTVAIGCFVAGTGFFYATMSDLASMGALNMHFLFAFAVIFASTGLIRTSNLTLAAWPAYLIRIYLVVVYFGSGWRKVVYGDWLNNPDALLHCVTGFFTTDLARWLYPIVPHLTWTLIQYGAVVFELGAPLLLLYPPLRKTGFILGCLLHLGIALLMKDLFYFSLQMITFYIPVLTTTSFPLTSTTGSGEKIEIRARIGQERFQRTD